MKIKHITAICICLIFCSGCSLFNSEEAKPKPETVSQVNTDIKPKINSRKTGFESWRTLTFTTYSTDKLDSTLEEFKTKIKSIEIKYNTNKNLADELNLHILKKYNLAAEIKNDNNDKLKNNVSITLFFH